MLPSLRHYPNAGFRFGEADSDEMVGESPAAWALRDALAAGAASGQHVLLTGESGSGKDVAARVVHRLAGRAGTLALVAEFERYSGKEKDLSPKVEITTGYAASCAVAFRRWAACAYPVIRARGSSSTSSSFVPDRMACFDSRTFFDEGNHDDQVVPAHLHGHAQVELTFLIGFRLAQDEESRRPVPLSRQRRSRARSRAASSSSATRSARRRAARPRGSGFRRCAGARCERARLRACRAAV